MKDPAFLFYSSDFLTGTMLMSNEQVGRYIRLICYQHQKGKIKPKDFDKIAQDDPDICEKFTVDEEGNYFNERLYDEIVKRVKYTESRRKNLLGKNSNNKTHMDKHMDVHMENENENINKDSNEVVRTFEFFWDHYHTTTGLPKSDKEPALKYWKKLTLEERRKAYDKVGDYRKSVNDPQYIKKARTYLSDKNFNDELRPAQREVKPPKLQNLSKL